MKFAFLAIILGITIHDTSYADCTQVKGLIGAPRSVCTTAWDRIATGKCNHYESYAPMWDAGIRRTFLTNDETLYTIHLAYNHDNVSYSIPMKIRYNEVTQKSEIEGYCCGYQRCEGRIH